MNSSKVVALIEAVMQDVEYHVEGKGQPIHFKNLSKYSVEFPSIQKEQREYLMREFADTDTKTDLEQSRVLNWCRTARQQLPLKTLGDGNCLCHSVSLFMWGIRDNNTFLRRLLYVSLVNDPDQCFQKRYLMQKLRSGSNLNGEVEEYLTTSEWQREWENLLEIATDTPTRSGALAYSNLENIHVFALSNILRRPIIIVADPKARTLAGESIQVDTIGGIYLPLFWSHDKCVKSPILLSFHMNHFCPLITLNGTQQTPGMAVSSLPAIPLEHYDKSFFEVHFLLQHEEDNIGNILRKYLKLTELVQTGTDTVRNVSSAMLQAKTLPDHLNVIMDLFDENHEAKQIAAISSPGKFNAFPEAHFETMHILREGERNFSGMKCIKECGMFGAPATANMCSSCFKEFTILDSEANAKISNSKNMPSAPFPSMTLPMEKFQMLQNGKQSPVRIPGVNEVSFSKPLFCQNCHQMQATHENFCKVCFFSMGLGSGTVGFSAFPQTKCIAPGCQENGNLHQNNLCPKCFVGIHQQKSVWSSAKLQPPRAVAANAKSAKAFCAEPGCLQLRENNSYNMCRECYRANKLKRPLESASKCSTENCSFPAGRNELALCEQCYQQNQLIESMTPKESNTGANKCVTPFCEHRTVAANKLCDHCFQILMEAKSKEAGGKCLPACKTPNCEFHGSGEFDGYCSRCFKMQNLNRIKDAKSKSIHHAAPLGAQMYASLIQKCTNTPVGKGRLCLKEGCKRYGDPNFSNLCTQCFNKQETMLCKKGCQQVGDQFYNGLCPSCYAEYGISLSLRESEKQVSSTAALKTSEEQSFSNLMGKLESSRKCMKCVNVSCHNYGNPRSNGYCHECCQQVSGTNDCFGAITNGIHF